MFKTDEKPAGRWLEGDLNKATPSPAPTGWKCPQCHSINAPHKDQCGSCNPRAPK